MKGNDLGLILNWLLFLQLVWAT